jgi:hypothetical protein
LIAPHYYRERELSNLKARQSSFIQRAYYGGSGPETTTTTPYTYFHATKKKSMKDSVNPYGSRGFRSPGPCLSTSVVRSGDVSVSWSDTGYVNPSNEHLYVHRYYDTDPAHYDLDQVVSYLPGVPASLVQDNMLASFNKMITQVPTEVSVANFLLELVEFKATFEHYAKAVTKGGLRLKDVPGWANSTFLDYSFNLKPFIGDLVKFTQIFDRVASRLDFLRRTRGVPVRQTFYNGNLWDENPYVGQEIRRDYRNAPYTANPNELSWLYGHYMGSSSDNSVGYTSLEVESFKAQFACKWTLLHELEGLDDAFAGLRGTIVALGLNNPAKIIWNAIPFSFVADWLAPFGALLERLAVQPFFGRWDIYDVTWSVKEVWSLRQNRAYIGWSTGYQNNYNPIQVERYTRQLGLDFDLTKVDFTDLTKDQQLLAASLFAGNTLFRSGKKHKAK